MLPTPDSNQLDPYTYKGTSVLINKAGLRDQVAAEKFETDMVIDSTQTLAPVLAQGLPSLDKFKAIHAHVFGQVYEWAGEFRTINISKGTGNFARPEYLESEGQKIFERLASNNYFKDLNKTEFVEKATDFFADLNALHPFREGNGRVTRSVLTDVARGAGYEVDLRAIDKDEWNQASQLSRLGNYESLKKVFSESVRPLRAIAFENMERNSAIERFPELAGAYTLLDAMVKRSTADFPNNRLAREKFEAQARNSVILQLNTGKVPNQPNIAKALQQAEPVRAPVARPKLPAPLRGNLPSFKR